MTSEVTQPARNAAADLLHEVGCLLGDDGIGQVADLIRDGEYDDHDATLAFAKFERETIARLTAQSGEGRSGAGEDDAGIAEKLAMRWRPIGRFASMPLDGTWFVARCTAPGYSAVRIVHYADRCDRLPIDHSGWVWPSAPTEWMPLDEFTAALNLTRSTALQTALEDICDPIAALRRYADERGRRLDGAVAFQLANDPNHIKGIARAALRATDDAGGAK
ncbi:hypothetical protein [Sphingopyxis terrae]|uniref:hypothetical protein n=1 Tax=Sphingopyxis terrae TaxID=33052 RepID=UPI000786CEAA|nr:hypothetical protein [Sphingopyxis terrae]